MYTVTIQKAKVTKTLAKRAGEFVASCSFGARSGKVGTADRKRIEEVTARVWCAVQGKGAVELTDLFTATDKVNEYHLAHARVTTAERQTGKPMKVLMFTEVLEETATSITGVTATSKGHGRVFTIPASEL